MADEFQAGDLVQLKSGGPPMTVDQTPEDRQKEYSYSDQYHCIWFKGATREHGYFSEHLLQRYVPPKKQ